MFLRFTNNKKTIRSGIGPLKDSAGNLVTDDQRKENLLNKYFSSVVNITLSGGNTDTNDINTNDVTNDTLVDSQKM